jgi:hypothetical protein
MTFPQDLSTGIVENFFKVSRKFPESLQVVADSWNITVKLSGTI